MPYQYMPLDGDDIRLLTIERIEDHADPASAIRCTLHHFSPLRFSEPSKQAYKGHNYVWPEINAPYDTATLFRKGINIGAPWKKEPATVPESTGNHCASDEQGLPWRHDWGDYIALSYTWAPLEPRRTITLNGFLFLVTPNLFDALVLLRRSQRVQQGFKLWVDAICINQNDLTERSQQVTRMRHIYASAWQVVTYLGAEADHSELAMTAFRWMAGLIEEAGNPLDGFYHEPTSIDIAGGLLTFIVTWSSVFRGDVYKAIFFFLTRQYWRRMWILQEVAMGSEDSPVACGNGYLSWKQVFNAAKFIEVDGSAFQQEIMAHAGSKKKQHRVQQSTTHKAVDSNMQAQGTWKLLRDISHLQQSQVQILGSDSVIDLLRLLVVARSAEVTDIKDRVYGILGFRLIAERVVTSPDYTLPASAIYQQFAKDLLSKGDLNILRLISRHQGSVEGRWDFGNFFIIEGKPVINSLVSSVWKHVSKKPQKEHWVGEVCSHQLPSWVVCWNCRQAPVALLGGHYRAGGEGTRSNALFSGPTLQVQGVIVDTIVSLGSYHSNEIDAAYPVNGDKQPSSAYGNLEATRAAFWRAIVADTTAQGDSAAPDSYSCLLDPHLWKRGSYGVLENNFGLQEILKRNKGLAVSGYALEELALGVKPGTLWTETVVDERGQNLTMGEREAVSQAMNAMSWRRLMGTRTGQMGLAPAGAKLGDSIAVMAGCDVPIALRKSEAGNGWIVIGECYVHGIMGGEAISGDMDNILLC